MKDTMSEQSMAIPFIGDLYNHDMGTFQGTCTSQKLPVRKLDIQDNMFEVEVGLSNGVDPKKCDPAQSTHIIVGIEIEVPIGGSLLSGNATADVLKNHDDTVIIPLENITVQPGNVRVIQYKMAPLSALPLALANKSSAVDEMRFLDSVAAIQELNNQLEGVENFMTEISKAKMISVADKSKLRDMQGKAVKFKEEFAFKCYPLMEGLNSHDWIARIFSVIDEIPRCQDHIDAFEKDMKEVREEYGGKKALRDVFADMGIVCVDNADAYREARKTQVDVYVLFFSKAFLASEVFVNTFSFFMDFIKKSKGSGSFKSMKFLAVDLDVMTVQDIREAPMKKTVIRLFRNGKCESMDLMGDMEKGAGLNVTRCGRRTELIEPKERGPLKIPCPQSVDGVCSAEVRDWVCDECYSFIDYGFNNKVYCGCGGALLNSYEFKCKDYQHGPDFVKFNTDLEKYFEATKPLDEINILVLGQSGVGKSTFIDSILNYIMYENIEVAKKSNLLAPIPIKFTITDNYLKSKEIWVGTDENEDKALGASATQDCRPYLLRFKQVYIRVIDTPGLGDTRGIEQDRINVKKILDHIKFYEKLHGICILLKPNESRIGVLLQFCVKEILTNLHKNCANNIVYCFTNTRSTFYKPGDTLPVLERLLNEIDVRNTLKQNTIYCFDNEAFRYLATLNVKAITWQRDDQKAFGQSWEISVQETKRLFDHIMNLKPHRTSETLSLNESRRTILSLTKPIADITQNIELNIATVQDHKRLIETWDKSDAELAKKLYVPQITLENVPLGYPRTVCTASRCVQYHVLPDSKTRITEFVTHCHPHCYLKGVTPEQYPNPDLIRCAAMYGGDCCMGCQCSWKTHQHILYDQTRTEIRVRNQSAESRLGGHTDAKREKEKAIRDLQTRVEELENEKDHIIKITGKFAYFLKKNAITPYNDVFADYVDYLIEMEEGKPNKSAKEEALLERMKDTRKKYVAEIRFLEEVLQSDTRVTRCEPEDVKRWQQELFDLPIHGQQLKRNLDVAMNAEDAASRYGQKTVSQGQGDKKKSSNFFSKVVENVTGWMNTGGRKKDHQNVLQSQPYYGDYSRQRQGNFDDGSYSARGRGRGNVYWPRMDSVSNSDQQWRQPNRGRGNRGGRQKNKKN